VQVRNAQTGEVVGFVGRHDRPIWSGTFSLDGKRLATASNDRTVRVWAWDPVRLGSEQKPELKLVDRSRGQGDRVAFSHDGQRLATGGEGHTVKIWDAARWAETTDH
jgi:WD40 repeat protein